MRVIINRRDGHEILFGRPKFLVKVTKQNELKNTVESPTIIVQKIGAG